MPPLNEPSPESSISSSQNQSQQDIGSNPGQVLGQQSGGQAINISGGTVFFQDSQGRPISLEASVNTSLKVPPLLPYLPDRTEQEYELGEAIQTLWAHTPRQPLICLVHGDEQQSHDQFLDRLQKVSLPRLLQLNLEKPSIKDYHLKWPASLKHIDKLSGRLSRNLADVVFENHSFASLEEINQTFGVHLGPVLVHMHLLTDDWKRLGPHLLSSVLSFWEKWPALAPHQTFVVCIFIKYRLNRTSEKQRRGWFFNPFAWLRRFLKYRRCQKLNQAIADELDALTASGFSQYQNFTGVVLSKLDNINRGHVEDWVRLKATKTFVGEAFVDDLLRAVGNMLEMDETLPMDQAAIRLKALLEETLMCGKEG